MKTPTSIFPYSSRRPQSQTCPLAKVTKRDTSNESANLLICFQITFLMGSTEPKTGARARKTEGHREVAFSESTMNVWRHSILGSLHHTLFGVCRQDQVEQDGGNGGQANTGQREVANLHLQRTDTDGQSHGDDGDIA